MKRERERGLGRVRKTEEEGEEETEREKGRRKGVTVTEGDKAYYTCVSKTTKQQSVQIKR